MGFKVSNDPRFEEKLVDIVALYLDPPEHAIVLSADEKSQIQALDRTQPGLPMKKGRCGTMTHDYKRNGTTTLFAALNTLDGTVISETMARHRHDEWLKFLKRLHRDTPKNLALHIICDNYATHKHPAVMKWLEEHKRVHIHFTPTSSSWLNMVERFPFGSRTRSCHPDLHRESQCRTEALHLDGICEGHPGQSLPGAEGSGGLSQRC